MDPALDERLRSARRTRREAAWDGRPIPVVRVYDQDAPPAGESRWAMRHALLAAIEEVELTAPAHVPGLPPDPAGAAVLRTVRASREVRELAWRSRGEVAAGRVAAILAVVRGRGVEYFRTKLAAGDLEPSSVERVVTARGGAGEGAWLAAKAARAAALGVDVLMPWDLGVEDAPGDAPDEPLEPRALVAEATRLGFDLRRLAVRVRVGGPAETIAVDPPLDVRLRAATLRLGRHELGHALVAASVDPTLPAVFTDAVGALHEGVAILSAADQPWRALLDERYALARAEMEVALWRGDDPDAAYWRGYARWIGAPPERPPAVWARLSVVERPGLLCDYAVGADVAAALAGRPAAELAAIFARGSSAPLGELIGA